MPLTTHAELIVAIQNFEDDASTVVSGVVADMVTLAEQRIYYGFGQNGADPFYSPALRVRAIERTVVLTIGAGTAGGTSAGSANTQTLTLTTAPTLVLGTCINFTAGYSNTGAMTINPNSVGATAVRKGPSRDALVQGDIIAGAVYTIYYDGTYFVLMASNGAAPLPANFLGVKSAYLQDRGVILTYQPNSAVNIFMDGASSGIPSYYTIEGDSLRLEPLPGQSYKVNVTYYEKPAALSTALNDVFRQAPNIYLYAALFELALYLPNDTAQSKWFSMFRGALSGYSNASAMGATTYGASRIRMGIAP